jgi:hypothetical protein
MLPPYWSKTMARLSLLFSLSALFACTKNTSDDSDTGDTSPVRDCSDVTEGSPPESGLWVFTIDTQLENTCENALGKGVHIHVGDTTELDLTRDGSCVDGQDREGDGVPIDPGFSDEGMIYTQWSGSTDGDTMVLDGWIEVPIGGTCYLGVAPVLSATMTTSNTLNYQMDAEISISQEGMCNGGALRYIEGKWTCDGGSWMELADACAVAQGDEPQHSLPSIMPCFQSWIGTGILSDQ